MMKRQSDLFRRLARRARLFERFEDGVSYLGGRRVRVLEGPPRVCEDPCLFVFEQAQGEDLLLTVTVTDAGPYALMLGYALCDQADELLRDICGFVRLSVRDSRQGAGRFVCARYRGRRAPDGRADRPAAGSSPVRTAGAAANSSPVRAAGAAANSSPVRADRPAAPRTAQVPPRQKKERASAGDASLF